MFYIVLINGLYNGLYSTPNLQQIDFQKIGWGSSYQVPWCVAYILEYHRVSRKDIKENSSNLKISEKTQYPYYTVALEKGSF